MSRRFLSLKWCLVVAVTLVLDVFSKPLKADEPTREVLLLVTKITAHREGNETRFVAPIKLVNATGEDLTVRTTFNTVFDGLVLEVTGKRRKVIASQPFTASQSPRQSPGIELPLKQGVTSSELVFSVFDLPKDTTNVRVRLTGSLPGHEEKFGFSTSPIRVRIR